MYVDNIFTWHYTSDSEILSVNLNEFLYTIDQDGIITLTKVIFIKVHEVRPSIPKVNYCFRWVLNV